MNNMVRTSVEKLNPVDKANFVITFAMLHDNYNCKKDFSKIINLFQDDSKENRSLQSYAILKISEHNSICAFDGSEYCKPLYFFKQQYKPDYYFKFDASDEIAELDLLLTLLTANDFTTKLFYHLAIFKYLNEQYVHDITIHNANENSNNLYIHTPSRLPILNLDIKSIENNEVISDFKSFYTKYPTIENSTDNNFNISLEENLFIENITFLNKCKHDFFQSVFERHSNFTNDDDIYSLLNLFNEFDDKYFKNILLKSFKLPSISECFTIENCNATINDCNFENEHATSSNQNVTLLILNLSKFIKNLIKSHNANKHKNR
jgi:hypothetical protein